MADKKTCSGCGKAIPKFAPFCPHCGSKQSRPMSEEEMRRDPFTILQVSDDAEEEVIDAAFRSLAKKYHPDTGGGDDDQERMNEINWAYSVLKDKGKRQEWIDKRRKVKTQQDRSSSTGNASRTAAPSSRPSASSKSQSSTTARSAPPRSTTYRPANTSSGGIKTWHVVVGVVAIIIIVSLASNPLKSSSANSASVSRPEPTSTYRPRATARPTNTPRPLVVNNHFQGGSPFGKDIDEVADYLDGECFTSFIYEDGSYWDFYPFEGFGLSMESENSTRYGPLYLIGILVDFSGDLIEEPNADMLADLVVCLVEETGVPLDTIFEWAESNVDEIFIAGNDGYFHEVRGYYVGGYYGDDMVMIIISEGL